MVLQTTIIEAEIKGKVDKQSFASAKKEVEKVGKQLDNVLEPEIKLAKLRSQLQDVNKEIRKAKKAGEKDREIELRINSQRIKRDIRSVNNELKKLKGETSGLTRLFNKAGAAIAGAFAVQAIVGGITNIVNSFSEATSTIIKETGATGEALEGLEASFQKVFSQVPQSAQEVGQAIGDVSTRFGVTGDALENLTKDFLDFSRVVGSDVSTSVRLASRLAKDFGVSIADTPLLLDKLTAASQATGVEVSKLADTSTKFGVQFRALGFGLDETIALLSKFEAEGVSTEKITSGLTQALGKLAKEGIDDPIAGFEELTKRIKEAGSVGDATRIAIDLLGSRAGPDFALAVREGRLEFQDFIGVIQDSQGTLAATAEASLTVGERLKVSFNGLISAAKPVFDFLGEGLISIVDGFKSLGSTVLDTVDTFKALLGSEEAVERLKNRHEDLIVAADETNQKVQVLTESITANATEMEQLNEDYKNGAISAEEYDKKIEELTAANKQLSLEQKALTITQADVQNALNAFNTASSQTEFNRLRQAALDAVQAMIIAKRLAIDESFKKGTPLISAGLFEATQQLAELESQFNRIQFATFQGAPTAPGGTPPGGGGAGGKSAATKAKENEIKDLLKIEAAAAKEREKAEKEAAKITEETFKQTFEAIGDAIEDREKDIKDFTKEIEKSADKIASLGDKIADVSASASEDLASRFVEIQDELAEPEIDSARRNALEEELALIQANTTAEERAEAVRQEGLSEAEKILETRDAELLLLQGQVDAEQAIFDAATLGRENALLEIENLRAFEKEQSDLAIQQTELEFLKKKQAAEAYKKELEEIIALSASGALGGAGAGGTIPTGGIGGAGGETTVTETTTINQNIEGVIDKNLIDLILNEAVKRIQAAKKQNL